MKWLQVFVGIMVSVDAFAFAYDGPIKLATHNLEPYGSYADSRQYEFVANENFTGTAVNVVRCSFNLIGYPVEIYVMPWSRAQEAVSKGKMHGFFAASQKRERDQFAVISKTVAEQKWTWYYLSNNPLTPQSPDFKSKAQVSSFNGANMQDWLRENHFNVSANPNDTQRLYEMLMLGRIDAALANDQVMTAIINTEGSRDLINSATLKDKPLAVYFSKRFIKQSPDFLPAFNRAVDACRLNSP